jgi:hypothetical protein
MRVSSLRKRSRSAFSGCSAQKLLKSPDWRASSRLRNLPRDILFRPFEECRYFLIETPVVLGPECFYLTPLGAQPHIAAMPAIWFWPKLRAQSPANNPKPWKIRSGVVCELGHMLVAPARPTPTARSFLLVSSMLTPRDSESTHDCSTYVIWSIAAASSVC